MSEKNPFKQLVEPTAPKALKARVMTSVELSQLLIDVTDLFTSKMGMAAISLFDLDPEDSRGDGTEDSYHKPPN